MRSSSRDGNAIRRILVVDDTVEVADITVEALRGAGYIAECRYDGSAGFEAAQTLLPDLVLTDYRMPGINGIKLLGLLKSIDVLNPLVFVASADIDFNSQFVYALGAEAVFLKPFGRDELLNTIERFSQPCEEVWSTSPGATTFEMHFNTEIREELGFFRSLKMGRGGLVLNTNFTPTLNDRIDFSIEIKDSPIQLLEGSGKVRWVADNVDGNANVGIEFEYIHSNAREELIRLIRISRDLLPYIPLARSNT